jgi:putative transposase
VLFFIHLSTRQVIRIGVTASPNSAWVTQHARNVVMDPEDQKLEIRLLLRDHDAKFSRSFDEVFSSQGTKVIPTPIQAPRAKALASHRTS